MADVAADPLRSIAAAREAVETIGPQRLMELALSRAAEFAGDNIFTTLDTGFALENAARATGGLLAGIPFIVKDNIDVAGYPTTGASLALGENRPEFDADSVAILRGQGAAVIGKASLHELAFGITNINAGFGTVINPFDPNRAAGGSSGGTAAAVSRGIVPFGLGTDTGGSIRIPAAHCGICGFRPSPDRYPRVGQMLLSETRDVLGTMANSIGDLTILDAILSGDEAQIEPPSRLRVGVVHGAAIAGFSKDHDRAMTAVLKRLSDRGIELIDVDFSAGFALDQQCGMPIAVYETEALLRGLAREALGLTLEDFTKLIASPDVRGIFEHIIASGGVPEAAYRTALEVERPLLQAAYAKLLDDDGLDLVLMATTAIPPVLIDEIETTLVDGVEHPTFATTIRHVSPASVAGVPSLSLPGGLTEAGLPFGILLEGRVNQDRTLLANARAVEALLA
jgi:mandelamide amidase